MGIHVSRMNVDFPVNGFDAWVKFILHCRSFIARIVFLFSPELET